MANPFNARYDNGGAYRVDVAVRGESRYASNGLTFDTEQDAQEYAYDLSCRWTMLRDWRIVPADHPQREPVDRS